MRNATNQAAHQGSEKDPRRAARQAVQTPDDDLKVRYFDDAPGGSLEKAPEETLEEDTIEDLKSRIAALEAGLQKLNAIDMNPNGKSLVEQALFENDRPAQRRTLRNLSLGMMLSTLSHP
jgi:hypothetical protein